MRVVFREFLRWFRKRGPSMACSSFPGSGFGARPDFYLRVRCVFVV
jgi:hypothetical protein